MTGRHLLYLGSIALWGILLATSATLSLEHVTSSPSGNPVGGGSPLAVTPKMNVGQAFVAPLPGLYRIDVTPTRIAAGSPQVVTFHLASDPPTDQDIWSTTISSDDLQPGLPFSFEFSPQRDSDGQSYYFYLEAESAAPSAAVEFSYNPTASLQSARAYVSGQPVPGSLQFQAFYSLRTRDKLGLLLSRMDTGRPYMFGTKSFYIGLGLVYVLVLGTLMLQLARTIVGRQEGEP